MPAKSFLIVLLLTAATFSACESEEKSIVKPTGFAALPTLKVTAVIANHADLVFKNYSDVDAGLSDLQAAIEEFIDTPSESSLTSAKEKWIAVRPIYGQTEAFRFAGGPIDDENGPEGQINAWPMDEGHVDYVDGVTGTGIIGLASDFPTIDEDLLIAQNENPGEENIATGFHAIEFLLWGQDKSTSGPGNRPYTDYTTAPNAGRRAAYLTAAVNLLRKDIGSVKDEWDPSTGKYRAAFLALTPAEAIASILTGIGVLSAGELSGERMTVALETKDQENEHSCFSDNTHNDIIANATGIQNVYLGRYGDLDGPGIDDLVALVDPALNAKLAGEIEASVSRAKTIPAPFDQAILGDDSAHGRKAIAATVDALVQQGKTFVAAGTALGLTISTALP